MWVTNTPAAKARGTRNINGASADLALSPARVKNGGAPGTHCLRMRLISPRCGDSRLFSDSSVSCDVRVRTRYSKLVRIL